MRGGKLYVRSLLMMGIFDSEVAVLVIRLPVLCVRPKIDSMGLQWGSGMVGLMNYIYDAYYNNKMSNHHRQLLMILF